jgi:hypothetical protein
MFLQMLIYKNQPGVSNYTYTYVSSTKLELKNLYGNELHTTSRVVSLHYLAVFFPAAKCRYASWQTTDAWQKIVKCGTTVGSFYVSTLRLETGVRLWAKIFYKKIVHICMSLRHSLKYDDNYYPRNHYTRLNLVVPVLKPNEFRSVSLFYFLSLSMALQPFGNFPLFQFLNPTHNR